MRAAPVLVALLALGLSGCVSHRVVEEVYSAKGLTVELRGVKKSGQFVSQGYEHPAIISPLRLARILAAIEVDTGEGDKLERTGIMPYSLFQPVAKALALALEQANDGQEIAVTAVLRYRRLGIFHKKYLSSFVTYVKDGELSIHLSRVNWEVPKGREKDLPTPRIGDEVMPFRVVPVRGMRRQGPQVIAARWRDPAFGQTAGKRPSDPTKVRRRTILMDERLPVNERDTGLSEEQLEGLSEQQIQALERLQDQRENGEITEDEYLRARDDIVLDRF
jgi:hypothetical protein